MIGQILKVRKKNNWLQGLYKSPKSRKLNNFKSSWELSFYRFLDNCKFVKNWESECVKIPYILEGKKKNYLPDVLINGKLLVEVKPKSQVNWTMNQKKFESARNFCAVRKWRFLIITKELMNPIYLTEQIKKLNWDTGCAKVSGTRA